MPVEFSYKDHYFYDKFEAIPEKGFADFISNMLNSNNINVILSEDAMNHIKFEGDYLLFEGIKKPVIYTGELDRLLNYKYGRLPYRSLIFEYEVLDGNFQNVAITAYPSHEYKFTRITEYNKMPYQNSTKTVIAKEYPCKYTGENEPYYPILTDQSKEQYSKYFAEIAKTKNIFIAGRLAEFKYYNMDQAVISALEKYEIIKKYYKE